MSNYIVSAENQDSEMLLIAYQQRRIDVQGMAGNMFQQILNTENAYTNFEAALGGEFAALADYHAAKQSPVAAAVSDLRAKMADVVALMRAMEAAAPGLFPGVTP